MLFKDKTNVFSQTIQTEGLSNCYLELWIYGILIMGKSYHFLFPKRFSFFQFSTNLKMCEGSLADEKAYEISGRNSQKQFSFPS